MGHGDRAADHSVQDTRLAQKSLSLWRCLMLQTMPDRLQKLQYHFSLKIITEAVGKTAASPLEVDTGIMPIKLAIRNKINSILIRHKIRQNQVVGALYVDSWHSVYNKTKGQTIVQYGGRFLDTLADASIEINTPLPIEPMWLWREFGIC